MPKIVQVYGKRNLEIGEVTNFRIRVQEGALRPIEYRWDFGGGHTLVGKMVAYRFPQAGQYTVTATARNALGTTSTPFSVRVTASTPRPDSQLTPGSSYASLPSDTSSPSPSDRSSDPTERRAYKHSDLYSSHTISRSRQGYTWVVATFLNRFAAELQLQHYRSAGYRVSLIEDERGRGSKAYRLAIGQFNTWQEAVAARQALPANQHHSSWLLPLSDLTERAKQ